MIEDGPQAVVWAAAVAGAAAEDDWSLLDAEETARAGRFHFAADRDRYVRRRAFLRRLLGTECGLDPRHIGFKRSPQGKLALAPGLDAALHFNQSARAGLTVVAVSRHGPLGVDIEPYRRLDDLEALAATVLTEREQGELAAIDAAERPAAFLRAWTAKEALLKATGDGLMVDPKAIELAIGRDPPHLRRCHVDAAAAWSLLNLDGLPDYAGAVAAQDPGLQIALRRVDARSLGS